VPAGLVVCGCDRGRPAEPAALRDFTFITHDGCVNTPVTREHLNAALSALGWPIDYQVIDSAMIARTDPRSGYPTPTVLYRGRELFGMAEPTPPYPDPT
jgi:hypothetical protein